jgi:hypothetical protein
LQRGRRNSARNPTLSISWSMILAHGELGVKGGGAARGAPTPQLDRMAHEGVTGVINTLFDLQLPLISVECLDCTNPKQEEGS